MKEHPVAVAITSGRHGMAGNRAGFLGFVCCFVETFFHDG
jgi:hypothetical protein